MANKRISGLTSLSTPETNLTGSYLIIDKTSEDEDEARKVLMSDFVSYIESNINITPVDAKTAPIIEYSKDGELDPSGETDTFNLTTESGWSITSPSYVTVTPNSSSVLSSSQSISFEFDANVSSPRVATLRVTDANNLSSTLVLSQGSSTTNLTMPKISYSGDSNIPASGDTILINVASDYNGWSLSYPTFVTIANDTGDGDVSNISVVINENLSSSSRVCNIVLTDGNGNTATLTLSQYGQGSVGGSYPTITWGGEMIDHYAGSTTSVDVTSDTDWEITTPNTWITDINPSTGNGDVSGIIVTALMNSGSIRSGQLTVTDNSTQNSDDVTIWQRNNTNSSMLIDPGTIVVSSEAGSFTFSVTGSGQWKAYNLNTWTQINGTDHGTSDAIVTIDYDENLSIERTGDIQINDEMGSGTIFLRITQQSPVGINVDPEEKTVSGSLGSFMFYVSSSEDFTISTYSTWITHANRGTGAAKNRISGGYEANDSGLSRTGWVIVEQVSSGLTATYYLTQNLPTITLSMLAYDFTGQAESINFNVICDGYWTCDASTVPSYMTVSPMSGNGITEITMSVDENTLNEENRKFFVDFSTEVSGSGLFDDIYDATVTFAGGQGVGSFTIGDKVLNSVSDIENEVSTLNSDVSTLNSDVSTLNSDVSTLSGSVSSLQTDVNNSPAITFGAGDPPPFTTAATRPEIYFNTTNGQLYYRELGDTSYNVGSADAPIA